MTQVPTDIKVGFIGNGYVGKHIADDFEHRGLTVVRYALETPYDKNKDAVGACDIVIVAVPTPTTPEGFDGRIVEDVLAYVQSGKIVVIKSTVTPGTTKRLQEKYPDLTLLFSPEFLREANAADDDRRCSREGSAARSPDNARGAISQDLWLNGSRDDEICPECYGVRHHRLLQPFV
jgi:UDP-glucose 6-dehydrogenase